jgi:predicted TIM-barrel fold metal-dependent hydrolase
VILDSHAHVDIVPALGWYDDADRLIAEMDKAGIAKAAISGYTNAPGPNPGALQTIADAVACYPDRLIGYARLDPWFDEACIRTLEGAVRAWGCRGVKLHPAHYTLHPFGDLTVRLVRRAGELGLPVLFHCGDEMMSLPYQIDRLARQCPETTIILAHIGGYFSGEAALVVAKRRANVLVDTSEVPFPSMVRRAVYELGAEKVLFGSDGPAIDMGLEILKVKLARLSPEQERLVLCGNYARLMGIDVVENHVGP